MRSFRSIPSMEGGCIRWLIQVVESGTCIRLPESGTCIHLAESGICIRLAESATCLGGVVDDPLTRNRSGTSDEKSSAPLTEWRSELAPQPRSS